MHEIECPQCGKAFSIAGSAIVDGREDCLFYGVPGFVMGGVLALISAALSATLMTVPVISLSHT